MPSRHSSEAPQPSFCFPYADDARLFTNSKNKIYVYSLRVSDKEAIKLKIRRSSSDLLNPWSQEHILVQSSSKNSTLKFKPNTADIRHEWILVRHHKQTAPHFKGRDFIYNIYRTNIYIYIYLKSNIYCCLSPSIRCQPVGISDAKPVLDVICGETGFKHRHASQAVSKRHDIAHNICIAL